MYASRRIVNRDRLG